MGWAPLAVLSAALFGMASFLVKLVVGRQVPNPRTFYLITGVLNMLIGMFALLVWPLAPGASLVAVVQAAAAGLVQSAGLMLFWLALRTEEVSRVDPITQTFPIFVAILASTFLGESLGPREWSGILATVAGAVLISARRMPGGEVLLSRPLLLLGIASLSTAVAQTLSKPALSELSKWNVLGIFFPCLSVGFFTVSLRRSCLQEAYAIVSEKPRSLLWVGSQAAVGLAAVLFQFAAIAVGPVSLVSTVIATRPFFVFVWAMLSSWLTPHLLREPLSPRILAVKLAAIAMIVGGGASVSLR
ncbi:MAG: EamA family transporter [Chloroflexi bacterium]|nr:EamA family transporter [Chloroflexota bacterium]